MTNSRSIALGGFWFFQLLILGLFSGSALPADSGLTRLDEITAPGFVLPDMDDKLHDLKQYRGQALIVNFWATWCPPCREELPSMNQAWEIVKGQNVTMLAINVGENEDQIFPFLGQYPIDFPILLDADGQITESWPIKGLPTTFILDTEGNLVYRAVGGRDWADPALLEAVLLLARKRQGGG